MDINFYLNKSEDCNFNYKELPIVLKDYKSLIDVFTFFIILPMNKTLKMIFIYYVMF